MIAISFASKNPQSAEEISGMPMRAGSALHTIFLRELGVTPVTMTASASYEALSRGTIDGMILSVGDWKSYSLQDLLKYTVTGVAVGHWGSYLAISKAAWGGLSPEQQKLWDEVARATAISNAEAIVAQENEVRDEAAAKGAAFTELKDLPASLKDKIISASASTWAKWIEQTEAAGFPDAGVLKARVVGCPQSSCFCWGGLPASSGSVTLAALGHRSTVIPFAVAAGKAAVSQDVALESRPPAPLRLQDDRGESVGSVEVLLTWKVDEFSDNLRLDVAAAVPAVGWLGSRPADEPPATRRHSGPRKVGPPLRDDQ